MNLVFAEWLFALILLLVAYLVSHTINGVIQSYVTLKLGDDTAKESGYLSFNPFVHMDVIGIIALVFFGFGWTQIVPIDPYAFTGRGRYLKLLLAYYTEALSSIMLAVVALFLSVFFYGYCLTSHLLNKIFTYYYYYGKFFMGIFSSTAHLKISETFAQHQSPVAIIFAYLLISIVYLNILIATISTVYNGFRYALLVGFERNYDYIEYADSLSFFGPLLVVYVFGDWLIMHYLRIAGSGACIMAQLVGA